MTKLIIIVAIIAFIAGANVGAGIMALFKIGGGRE